jgi:hypothetical protein
VRNILDNVRNCKIGNAPIIRSNLQEDHMGNVEATRDPWEMASVAKVHLQQMDDFLNKGDKQQAEDEFEKAWQLMANARDAFLEEIKAEYARDMADDA